MKYKVYNLLGSFSSIDWKRFGDFIQSPYHNKNQRLIPLLNGIKRDHPNYQNIDKEALFSLAYPEKDEYHDGLYRSLISDLSKLIEQYFVIEKIKEQPDVYNEQLLRMYEKRNLSVLFEKKVTDWLKEIDCVPEARDEVYFSQKYVIERQTALHNIVHKKIGSYKFDNHIQALDNLYFIRKVVLIVNNFVTENAYNISNKLGLCEPILEYLEKHNYNDEPYIELYSQAARLFQQEKILFEEYNTFKKTIQNRIAVFPINASKQLYRVLTLMIQKVVKHDTNVSLYHEGFKLYKEIVEFGLIYEEDSFITPRQYWNAITCAINSGEFDWAEHFMQKYREKINPKFREHTHRHCEASYLFSIGKFDQAEKIINLIQIDTEHLFIDRVFNVNHRLLQTKLYYELNQFELLMNFVDTNKKYIQRSNIYTHDRKKDLNYFFLWVLRLCKLKIQFKSIHIEQYKQLQKNTFTHDKDWLIEKAKELL